MKLGYNFCSVILPSMGPFSVNYKLLPTQTLSSLLFQRERTSNWTLPSFCCFSFNLLKLILQAHNWVNEPTYHTRRRIFAPKKGERVKIEFIWCVLCSWASFRRPSWPDKEVTLMVTLTLGYLNVAGHFSISLEWETVIRRAALAWIFCDL